MCLYRSTFITPMFSIVPFPRVVQCSDKGVEKVPYGIPYNSRYVLLMNNRIDSIQLDLLNEYLSMEFLVLSNNRLTDGSIEGAFEGIPALRRLYLDRNLLESVPTDLPASLEELRLDNNRLNVMSEGAWAHCPSLLVLSLSNNSLGNGNNTLTSGQPAHPQPGPQPAGLGASGLTAIYQGVVPPWQPYPEVPRGGLYGYLRAGDSGSER